MPTKVALITGTSRPVGLGFAVAEQLAQEDYHVILTARDASRAEHLAEQLRQHNHVASALRLDLTEPATFHEAAAYVAQTFGHLDVLINNATHGPDFTILSALDADLDAVRTALEVDLIGTWGLILAMLPLLKEAPAARIVNAVDPGETATHPERGDEDTARPAAENACGIVWAATLDRNGPTGGVFRDKQPVT